MRQSLVRAARTDGKALDDIFYCGTPAGCWVAEGDVDGVALLDAVAGLGRLAMTMPLAARRVGRRRGSR